MNPLILAIESSGDDGGACLWRDGKVIAEVLVGEPRSHGSRLVACVDEVFQQAGVERSELRLIVVNAGPGSYTGLRIGVSCAETLGLALGVPVLGVNCLLVMAVEALTRGIAGSESILVPALDARQGEVATQAFRRDGDKLLSLSETMTLPPARLGEVCSEGLVFGQGCAAYPDQFPDAFTLEAKDIGLRPSSTLAAAQLQYPDLCERAWEAGKRVIIEYFRPITAKTLVEREADAERKRAGKSS